MAARRQLPWFAGLVLAALVLTALLAPYPGPPQPHRGRHHAEIDPAGLDGGGDREHLLGTDRFGRDVLSRIIWGSRISLAVSLIAIGVAGTLGTLLGLISGYRGGLTDAVLMRLTDIGLSLPTILIAVVMVAVSEPSFRNVILVIALLLWPRFARQVRGETLGIKEQDFVALAVVAGRSSAWIIRRHIFPNVVPTLLVISTLQVGLRDSPRGHAELPGRGRAAAQSRLGADDRRWPRLPGHRLVDLALPGPRDAPHRAGGESDGGLAARPLWTRSCGKPARAVPHGRSRAAAAVEAAGPARRRRAVGRPTSAARPRAAASGS